MYHNFPHFQIYESLLSPSINVRFPISRSRGIGVLQFCPELNYGRYYTWEKLNVARYWEWYCLRGFFSFGEVFWVCIWSIRILKNSFHFLTLSPADGLGVWSCYQTRLASCMYIAVPFKVYFYWLMNEQKLRRLLTIFRLAFHPVKTIINDRIFWNSSGSFL
jgi:hypothetical protein